METVTLRRNDETIHFHWCQNGPTDVIIEQINSTGDYVVPSKTVALAGARAFWRTLKMTGWKKVSSNDLI